jgi:voltage-gated potassium channel
MKIKNKLYNVLFLTFVLLTVGATGYMLLGDYSIIDALYMTVITISTVGFREVHPLSDAEKLFTIFLILTSISIFGYIISVVTEFIANGGFLEELKMKRVQKKIQKLEQHSIVCGYGRNGRQAVIKLCKNDETCVVIESDKDLVREIEDLGIICVTGDATDDTILEKAGIKAAANLITTLPRDSDNLYVVLSARQYNANVTIISRASRDTSERKLKIAGANNVIMPDRLGGDHMASLVVSPDIIEFVDKLSLDGNCDTNLQEILIDDLPNEFINMTLLKLDLRRRTGCSVIGFKTPENEYIVNPEPETELIPNSKLIVLGRKEQIEKLQDLF